MPLQTYRPRSASELVDAALQLFRRHYTPLVALMAIGYLPVMIVLLVFRDELGMTPVMQNPTAPPSQILSQMGPLFAIWLVLMLYFYVVMGALTVASSDVYLDERMDVGKSFRIAISKSLTLFASAIVKVLILVLAFLGVGIVAALFGGILAGAMSLAGKSAVATVFLAVFAVTLFVAVIYVMALAWARFAAAGAAVVLESAGIGINRSLKLTKDNARRVLGAMLLVWVIYLVGLGVVAAIGIGIMRSLLLYQLLGALYNVLAFPLVAVTQTLVYYDLRIRKEGFDLELMARLPAAGGAMAPLSP